MPPMRREHPAAGWACTYDRSSVHYPNHQDTHYNQTRLNEYGATVHGLKIKPGYNFSDPGKSASKGLTRKDLERGTRAVVVEKAVEAMIVPNIDRLSREGARHVLEMLDAFDAVGGRIIFVADGLDSSDPESRAIIAFLAERARSETRKLSWRIGIWHEGCRIQGKWTGKRPYGYKVIDGRLTPDPEEAAIIQRIAEEYLSGKSLLKIAKALNAEGVASPGAAKALSMRASGREPKERTDSPWSGTGLAKLLRSPSLVAWQWHKGRTVVDSEGEPVSFGEGILTPGEHATVLLEIERRTTIVRESRTKKREVGTKTGGGRSPRYLLTGIARCQACGYRMRSLTPSTRNVHSYRCGTLGNGQPCPAPALISMESAEAEVMHQLRTRLGALEPGDPILDAIAERWRELMMPEGEDERAVIQSRRDAIRGRIVDLDEARYVRGEFVTPDDTTRWNNMMDRLKLQRDAIEDELEALGPPPDFNLNSLRATYSAETWDSMPVEQRRKWLQIAVAKITISSSRKRPVPAADRVRVFLVGEEREDAE